MNTQTQLVLELEIQKKINQNLVEEINLLVQELKHTYVLLNDSEKLNALAQYQTPSMVPFT